jgi:hypothetical protein
MKESFNIYVEKETRESYKKVCKKVGIKPSLRIQIFMQNDLGMLNTYTKSAHSLSTKILSDIPKKGETINVPFTITIDPKLRDDYKTKCEALGTSASIRISAFIASDLERLNILLPSLLSFRNSY